jgi:hypothetical protein
MSNPVFTCCGVEWFEGDKCLTCEKPENKLTYTETILYTQKDGNIVTELKQEHDLEADVLWWFVDTYKLRTDESGETYHDYINNSGSLSDKREALGCFLDDLDCFQNGASNADAQKELDNERA